MKIGYELIDGSKVEAYDDYYEAERQAKEQGLKLAEYGDIYCSKIAYCYYNKSGNRNETEQIICYYVFDNNGKPKKAFDTMEDFERFLFD